jgi:chromosomal replication initiation ATPase DnaA
MIEFIQSLYEVTQDDLQGASRKANVVEARQMCWLILHRKAKHSLCKIAKQYNRTHPTIHSGIQHVENLIQVDKKTRSFYQKAIESLSTQPIFAE